MKLDQLYKRVTVVKQLDLLEAENLTKPNIKNYIDKRTKRLLPITQEILKKLNLIEQQW